ncbi:hypothetical protein V6N13_015392 [Hibiscus sabdariffa]
MDFITLLIIVLSSLSLKSEAQQPSYIYHVCSNTSIFAVDSTYRSNRDTVLSRLVSNTSHGNGFYNTTAGSSPDTVYGISHCRVDISTSGCHACIAFADVAPLRKQWLLVRHGEEHQLHPARWLFRPGSVGRGCVEYERNINSGGERTECKKICSRGNQRFRDSNTVHPQQCTPDLLDTDCRTCLQRSIQSLSCCVGKQGGGVLNIKMLSV